MTHNLKNTFSERARERERIFKTHDLNVLTGDGDSNFLHDITLFVRASTESFRTLELLTHCMQRENLFWTKVFLFFVFFPEKNESKNIVADGMFGKNDKLFHTETKANCVVVFLCVFFKPISKLMWWNGPGSTFTQLLYLRTTLRYFTWVFQCSATLYFHFTTFETNTVIFNPLHLFDSYNYQFSTRSNNWPGRQRQLWKHKFMSQF